MQTNITVNCTKTKFLLFSKISPLTSPINLSCGGLTIEEVESIRFVGVAIDLRLNWDLYCSCGKIGHLC